MKATFAGVALVAGISMTAHAETFHFTPITDPSDPILQSLGTQITMDVTQGSADNVLFTFTNPGDLESSVTRVYVDDAPSNLFSSFDVGTSTPGVNFALNASPANLTGGNDPAFNFSATDSAAALKPRFNNGVNDSSEAPGEAFVFSGILNAGKTFADVITSLTSGGPTNSDFLRVGLRAIGIDQFNDSSSASFLNNAEASTPPPVPEPSSYGMLLAGLGLMTAIARRKQSSR